MTAMLLFRWPQSESLWDASSLSLVNVLSARLGLEEISVLATVSDIMCDWCLFWRIWKEWFAVHQLRCAWCLVKCLTLRSALCLRTTLRITGLFFLRNMCVLLFMWLNWWLHLTHISSFRKRKNRMTPVSMRIFGG